MHEKKQVDTSQGHGNISADRSAYGIAEKKCIFDHHFLFKKFVLTIPNSKIDTIRPPAQIWNLVLFIDNYNFIIYCYLCNIK